LKEPLLHYDVHGSGGPYLLLVHGMLSSRAQWLANVPALSSFCRPVVVELLGHGRSPSPEEPTSYTPQAYVAEFEHLRQFLGADRWLVCGQSLGAALTLRYALDKPERVLAHVFTNSNSALAEPGWRHMVLPLMQASAQRLAKDGRKAIDNHPLNPGRATRLPADVRNALVEDARLHDPQGVALTGLHTVPDSPVRERVAGNTVRSLLVVGEREKRFRAHREFAEEHMPLLSVVGLDAGHAVNAEAAEAFNREVGAFVMPGGREPLGSSDLHCVELVADDGDQEA
jgi:pimeloyl-ACP methyl ester carboxylesterase